MIINVNPKAGQAVRAARVASGLGLRQAAIKIGMRPQQLSDLEAHWTGCTLKTAARLLTAFPTLNYTDFFIES